MDSLERFQLSPSLGSSRLGVGGRLEVRPRVSPSVDGWHSLISFVMDRGFTTWVGKCTSVTHRYTRRHDSPKSCMVLRHPDTGKEVHLIEEQR